jgi:hypothetical protein
MEMCSHGTFSPRAFCWMGCEFLNSGLSALMIFLSEFAEASSLQKEISSATTHPME